MNVPPAAWATPGERYDLNCSMALADTPTLEMASRAAGLGFEAVEFWWPFDVAEPSADQRDAFVASVLAAGVSVASLNFYGGGPQAGGRGLAAVSERRDDFLVAARTAVDIGHRLGVSVYNPMFGNAPGPWEPSSAVADAAVDALCEAEQVVRSAGGVLAVEALSGFPDYPLRTFADARSVVERVQSAGGDAIGVLADVHHLHANGDDVGAVLSEHGGGLAHLQVADSPGRGWPGTGDAPLSEWIAAARSSGYEGSVGLECHGPARPISSCHR